MYALFASGLPGIVFIIPEQRGLHVFDLEILQCQHRRVTFIEKRYEKR